MARKKKIHTATILKAKSRLDGLKHIDPKLDLGGGMTVTAFDKEVTTVMKKVEDFNAILREADRASNELEAMEKQLGRLSSRMLAGVVTRFGRDSSEYEIVGGVRTSDRKRRKPQPAAEATTA